MSIKRVKATWRRGVASLSLGGVFAAACAGSDSPAIDAELADDVAAAYAGATARGAGGSAGAAGAGGSTSATSSANPSLGGSSASPAVEANGGSAGLGGGGSAQAGSSSLPAAGAGGSAPTTPGCDGFAILAANCGTSGCHGENSNLGTFAASESAARSYIGKSGTVTCVGQGPIIDPSDPATSMLVQKMGDDPPCGNYMPPAGALLSETEIACIEDWMARL